MTEKEFKKLSRSDLLDIIFQLQGELEEVQKKNQDLEHQLADRRLRIENAGTLAEAAASLNDLFATAQKTADIYLEELKQRIADITPSTDASSSKSEADTLYIESKDNSENSVTDETESNRADTPDKHQKSSKKPAPSAEQQEAKAE